MPGDPQLPAVLDEIGARRLALLEWAQASDSYIVEDDFDSEYRYEGSPLPALMSLDRNQRVIYVGSFSKVLAPNLRLGFVVVPGRLLGAMRQHLQRRGAMASLFLQPVLAELMATWNRGDAMDFAQIMVDHIVPPYRALMESYDKAQKVQKEGRETKLEKLEATRR